MEAGSVLEERYEIQEQIGRGGWAQVHRGVDRKLQRPVAVKLARAESEEADRLVRREAAFLRCLQHPLIPVVYDQGEADSSFLVMEYVEGVTLQTYVAQKGPFTERKALEKAIELLELFVYLHEKSPAVLYCDLKPDNIMVQRDGSMKLIDWGAAVVLSQDGRKVRRVAGTNGYAAPEQRTGGPGREELGPSADMYAFGKTLYYMVTGADPSAPPYGELSIRCYEPTLSRRLDQVIRKCTMEKPCERYGSTRELMGEMQECLRPAGRPKICRRAHRYIRKVEKSIWLSEKKRECTF